MKAYWLEHGPGAPIDAGYLATQGIIYEAMPTEPVAYQGPLDALKAQRGYIQQDIVELRPDTPNLEAICDTFKGEHTHDDDEVRFVLEGEGIFDIRDDADRWMRVEVSAGDLIVVPKDRHHLFLLTDTKHIRCVRLFQDAAGWVPRYREAH